MESKHSLLKRQLKKYLKNVDKIPKEINELLNVINEAYNQFDTDRKMLERSLELSSQELFQASSEMRAIFQAFPDHLFLIDENGIILDYKSGIIDKLNLHQGNIIGRNIRETPLAEITGLLLNSIKNVLNSQTIKHIEYSLILNESEVFFETRLVPFKNNQVICITRDITSTKLAEIALRMSETRYRTQFETAPDAIFILQNNKFVDCNPQTLEIFKCGKEDIIGQTPDQVSPPTQPDGENSKVKALEYINKALTGKPLFFEWQHCKLDGTLFDTEVSLKRFDIGDNIFLMAIVHDITDRKQAEIELAAEKERLAVTLESITDGVISTDVNGFIILMNKVAEEMTGWKGEEAIGLRIEDIFHIQDENTHSPLKNPIHEIVASGKAIEFKDYIELIARDNTIRIISNCGGPIQNHLNEISGVVLVFKDVTESRKIEEQIFNARKLESAGVLAGGIAHDFNNILTGILGNVSLAKFYAKDNQKIFEKLVNAEKAALRARELTYQLLTFAKGGSPVKQTASIVELIKESIYFVLRGSNVKGEFHIPDDLWSVNIDKGQINQVFNNIVINADQAMPEGGIISISGENVTINEDEISTLKPGKYIKISIKDTGVGISPNHIKKIFDPYFTTKSNGNGLGLTSSYSIVNKHGGNIIVESVLGEGTVFHIYLPATGELIKTIATREEPVKGKGRILLMDDEELVRHSAAAQLKFLGYSVDLVEDGNKLLKKFDEEKKLGNTYDLVILDLTIPGGMGGEKAIELLLDIDPNVKAIVSSGYSDNPVMAKYKEYGFCGVMTKPYLIEELSKVIKRTLEGKG